MAPKDVSGLTFDIQTAPERRALRPPRSDRFIAALMVATDILALALAFVIGTALSYPLHEMLTGSAAGYGLFGPRAEVMPALMGLMVAVFGFRGLYQRDGWEAEEIRCLALGVAVVALFDAALAWMTQDHFSWIWFALTWPLAVVMIVALRMWMRVVPWVQKAMTSYVVVMGSGIRSEDFLYQLRESRSGPIRLVATLPLGAIQTLSLNDLSDWLADQAAHEGIDQSQIQVVLTPAPEEATAARVLTERLSSLRQPFLVTVSYDGLARRGLTMHKIIGADLVLAGVTPTGDDWAGRVAKRAMDLLLTGFGMIVIAPVMMTIAVLIKLEDGGPVFFRQRRVGRSHRRFDCLKFRSMRTDAEERLTELLATDPAAKAEWDKYQKLTDDPRITRIGRFLRATSLDELPQLINVLRGDMSLVGPRPIIGPEIKGYDSDASYYNSAQFRHYARCVPGITGLWQVSGRHKTSHSERVRLDRWYARNWSIWLDLAILFKTTKIVLNRSGG